MIARKLLVLPLLCLGSLVACSSSPDAGALSWESGSVGRVAQKVIKGKNSDSSQDAVVLLVHFDPRAGSFGSCTGTLLAPRLVLTARHCVADTDEYAACDVDGEPLAAGAIRANHKPETMYVFTGPQRPNFGSRDVNPAGVGMKILDDGGKNLCNHDIALVVLKEPVQDAAIAPIRLDGDVELGEIFTAVGWGVTDKTPEPQTRQQRAGIKVTGVGPEETDRLPVPPNEFQVGESICSGDSGGPAIAESGAVMGVVSRGGNAKRPDQQDPAATCIGGENLYTKISPFKEMLLEGYELAEAEPWVENGPDPRLLKPGNACADGAECRSSLCLADPSASGATTCAEDCSVNACPSGLTCVTEGAAQVCRDPASLKKEESGGCSSSPGRTTNGALGVALAVLGLVAARRRRPSI
ncbi:MAG: S1 family peptidase [Labilithrix sp.]|nr:S1 family peptidase [Labilithrix sp.]